MKNIDEKIEIKNYNFTKTMIKFEKSYKNLLEEKINEKNFNNYLKYPLKIKKKFRR
jgi:hypothetical protein